MRSTGANTPPSGHSCRTSEVSQEEILANRLMRIHNQSVSTQVIDPDISLRKDQGGSTANIQDLTLLDDTVTESQGLSQTAGGTDILSQGVAVLTNPGVLKKKLLLPDDLRIYVEKLLEGYRQKLPLIGVRHLGYYYNR